MIVRTRGFSLLELSVVLMVITLLAGGVMVGKDLIRQSAVRSVVSDVERIKAAVDSFRDMYGALAGDMPNATDIWGTAAACPPTADFIGTATCNGNRNGKLYPNDLSATGTAPEWWYAWHHLSNAKLIEGHYSGRPGSGGLRQAVPGQNVMAGRMKGTGYTLDSWPITSEAHATWWSGQYDLVVHFGLPTPVGHTATATLTPDEAFWIDEKMDDGKPGLGIVRTYKDLASPGVGGECTSPNGPTTRAQKRSRHLRKRTRVS